MRTQETTDRESAERERRRELADRFAGVGMIAGGVAHDLSTPLAVAIEAQKAVLQALERGDLARASAVLGLALEATQQIETLVSALKSALYPSKGAPLEIADVLAEVCKLAAPQIRAVARLYVDAEPGLRVAGDRARLMQVFLHILVNAAQAVEGAFDDNAIDVRARREGRSIVVEIEDTGRGIPEGARARIFEPFFSTKPAGKGAGLGLFVSSEIVRALGGTIGLASKAGRGAAFRVTLPASEPGERVTPLPAEPMSGRRRVARSGAVLVIDDDPEVGPFLQHCAASEHRIDCCSDPEYALTRIRAGIGYDLIFCASVMGAREPHGRAMSAAKFCELAGDLRDRVVLLLGRYEPEPLPDFAGQLTLTIVRKPLTIGAVRGIISARISADRLVKPA